MDADKFVTLSRKRAATKATENKFFVHMHVHPLWIPPCEAWHRDSCQFTIPNEAGR